MYTVRGKVAPGLKECGILPGQGLFGEPVGPRRETASALTGCQLLMQTWRKSLQLHHARAEGDKSQLLTVG